jgi:hypothetical protein
MKQMYKTYIITKDKHQDLERQKKHAIEHITRDLGSKLVQELVEFEETYVCRDSAGDIVYLSWEPSEETGYKLLHIELRGIATYKGV